MGDWERIFGAGTTAEDVAASINASWEHEQDEEHRRAYEELNPKPVGHNAFHNDEDVRQDLMQSLERLLPTGALLAAMESDRTLSETLSKTPEFLAEEYGIPEGLIRAVDAMFVGLSPAYAISFPFQFYGAIKTGSNLTGVIPRMSQSVIRGTIGTISKSRRYRSSEHAWRDLHERCSEALCVIEMRARGFEVPEEVSTNAVRSVRAEFEDPDEDEYSSHADIDHAAWMVVHACHNNANGLAIAMLHSAKYLSDGRRGHPWDDWVKEMIDIIHEVPCVYAPTFDLSPILSPKKSPPPPMVFIDDDDVPF